MREEYQKIIDRLNINIELFLERLAAISTKKQLSELDKTIICQCLLGRTPKIIAEICNEDKQTIRDRLYRYIYPRIEEIIPPEQPTKEGYWTLILNFLLDSANGYKLNPTFQLNSDNFQGSFGRQIFLHPPNQEVARSQIAGTRFYQQGLYYQALLCFLEAWKKEKDTSATGNPEVLIYLNNCLIECQKNRLKEKNIKVYKLVVVVPFYHNQGRVAGEILRGIAQIQFQVNLQSLGADFLKKSQILGDIIPNSFSPLKNLRSQQIAWQILIVNDPNNLYDPFNQTAEGLGNLAFQLNLVAVLGHYSSEMTQKALNFYAKKGLLLVNSSSTSDELSTLPIEQKLSFFRLTTPDRINAKYLVNYLSNNCLNGNPAKVAIIYNKNSSYSTSYKIAVEQQIAEHKGKFKLLQECSCLSEDYYKVRDYIAEIKQQNVDIIILIPDGGIEPNSLNNTASISRLGLQNCLIAGSATFYQENVLHWQDGLVNFNQSQIIACIPWHWNSQNNGSNSSNSLAEYFCQIGTELWGEENLTWRSATAFDSGFIILRVLELHHLQNNQLLMNSQSLLEQMDRYFKREKNVEMGVTGRIEFAENGDRINPPAEIVSVKWNEQRRRWKWEHLKSM
ncbi:hypothetical protein ACE1CI_20765 [Aerosakkonemataceae cyanobacterium BLCC-F50]|uniref:Leucine-binding protein domain-containing protein n=1 Tax=Floridaenema flaviceps BLCC-F50 TaxID=3153642 RepID=A0ABV4XUE9_9CYAN